MEPEDFTEEFLEQAKQALMDIGLPEDEAEREVEDFYQSSTYL